MNCIFEFVRFVLLSLVYGWCQDKNADHPLDSSALEVYVELYALEAYLVSSLPYNGVIRLRLGLDLSCACKIMAVCFIDHEGK